MDAVNRNKVLRMVATASLGLDRCPDGAAASVRAVDESTFDVRCGPFRYMVVVEPGWHGRWAAFPWAIREGQRAAFDALVLSDGCIDGDSIRLHPFMEMDHPTGDAPVDWSETEACARP